MSSISSLTNGIQLISERYIPKVIKIQIYLCQSGVIIIVVWLLIIILSLGTIMGADQARYRMKRRLRSDHPAGHLNIVTVTFSLNNKHILLTVLLLVSHTRRSFSFPYVNYESVDKIHSEYILSSICH